MRLQHNYLLLFIILLLISKFRVLFFFFSTPYFSTYLAQFIIYMVRSHPSSSSIFSDSTALGSHGILSFFFIYLQQFLWTFFISEVFFLRWFNEKNTGLRARSAHSAISSLRFIIWKMKRIALDEFGIDFHIPLGLFPRLWAFKL